MQGIPRIPRISLEEAEHDLARLIEQIRTGNASFELTDKGEVVTRIVPAQTEKTVTISDLDEIFAHLPELETDENERFLRDLETVRKENTLPELKWE